MIGAETVNDHPEHLAAREPIPGGGAAGALHVAQSAALVGMVARRTTGAKCAGHEERSSRIAARADDIIPAAPVTPDMNITAITDEQVRAEPGPAHGHRAAPAPGAPATPYGPCAGQSTWRICASKSWT